MKSSKPILKSNCKQGIEPLRSSIGERGNIERCEELAQGKYTPSDIEEGTKLWFERINEIPINDKKITWTTDEYIDSWRIMDEKKSVSQVFKPHI